jgi:hypothetical protein
MLRLKTIVALFLVAMVFAASSGEATNKTFPAGTYIIPMDSVYQPSAGGGIFEAYGLVFDLLQNGATVYWMIDESKTSISAPDITILNTTTTPVVSGFPGTTIPAPAITTTISYAGAPFVVVPAEGISVASQEAIFNHADWAAVQIHKTNVAFTANVSRELKGTPPKIALLNNEESTASGTGNAQILESYMSLAGICNDTYDIVTPNQVRDGILDTGGYTVFWAPHWTAYSGWTGGSSADADAIMLKIRQFLEAGNSIFAECASIEVMEHSYNGHYLTTNGVPPASGSVSHGGGISHDGGTMDPLKIVYHDATSPFPQVGDFTYTPEGGHLHNWRPWMSSNYLAANNTSGEAYPFTPVPTVATTYNPTVSRFTYDDKDTLTSTPLDQWDYYTGGRIDGNENMGYAVYLGGHKYGTCSTGSGSGAVTPANEKLWKFTMKDNISTSTAAGSAEIYTVVIVYTYNGEDHTLTAPITKTVALTGMTTTGTKVITGLSSTAELAVGMIVTGTGIGASNTIASIDSATQVTLAVNSTATSGAPVTITFQTPGTAAALGSALIHPTLIFQASPDPLELDFRDATLNGKKIDTVYVRNKGTFTITIKSITVSWTHGTSQHTDKLEDITNSASTVDIYTADHNNAAIYDSTHDLIAGWDHTISPAAAVGGGGAVGGCVNNSGCTWTNVAGVRYVLNTLFNLQYTTVDTTYIRSSPVVMDITNTPGDGSIMYQGSFDYPSMSGHVRAFNVSSVTAGAEILDLATYVPASASRNLKTSMDGHTLIPFNTTQLAADTAFQTALGLSVAWNAASATTTATYNNTVNRIRGVSNPTTGADKSNRLGGVEHSAVAIVKLYSRSNSTRHTMAYFGTLDGVLEAFDVNSLHGGAGTPTEVWGFVPKGQLASLQHIRNQPSSIQPYPGVDASPTVAEMYYDHDSNPATNNWRTILATLTGKYGASPSVIAMDITDPTAPTLLWEKTRADTGLSLLGSGMRASMGVVKNAAGVLTPVVFAATNKKVNTAAIPAEHGGIQAYAFRLDTGALLWQFSSDYSGSQNDLPGAITAIDKDQNGYEDTVLIGDMDGRLWELNALTGANVNGVGIPLFAQSTPFKPPLGGLVSNAGVNYPIAASPSITVDKNNHLLAVFGTGGTDWAPADAAHIHSIIAIDMTEKQSSPGVTNGAGYVAWQIALGVGEKSYGSPTIAHNSVYVATAYGTMESANPSDDLASSGGQSGNLRAINLNTGALDSTTAVGNMRGAVYVKDGHAYTSTLDGQVAKSAALYTSGGAVNTLKLLWKQQ